MTYKQKVIKQILSLFSEMSNGRSCLFDCPAIKNYKDVSLSYLKSVLVTVKWYHRHGFKLTDKLLIIHVTSAGFYFGSRRYLLYEAYNEDMKLEAKGFAACGFAAIASTFLPECNVIFSLPCSDNK